MSVPMIGPGPLEGGPKGSPGPAKNADGFSACLKEKCGREAAPVEGVAPPNGGGSVPPAVPGVPKPAGQPPMTGGAEPTVATVPPAAQPVLAPTTVAVDCAVPCPLSVKETSALVVISPETVLIPVEGDFVKGEEKGGADEEDSDTDVPSLLKEPVVSAPPPAPSPIPLVVAEVPVAVVGPDTDQSFSTQSVNVEAVSGPERVSNTDFVRPVVENPKNGRETLSSFEPDRPMPPPPADQTSVPSIPTEKKNPSDGHPPTPEFSRVAPTSPSRADQDFDVHEMGTSQKPESPIAPTSTLVAGAQPPVPQPESKIIALEQEATFREALKAVAEAGNSFKGSAGVVLTGEGVVSTPGIEKGVAVETVRPALPVLTPSPIELAKQIHVHLESGRSVVHVELHPEHLGEMNIALETKGKDVSMRFTVENDTARHSVVAGLKELSGSLNTLGWTVNGLAVQVSSGGVGNGRSDADGSRWAAFPVNTNPTTVEQKTEPRPSPSGAWRVDLVA